MHEKRRYVKLALAGAVGAAVAAGRFLPTRRRTAAITVVKAEATSAGISTPAAATIQTRMIVSEPARVATVALGFC
jgi:hypothetical protein